MLSAICFNLDQFKIMSSGNGLRLVSHLSPWENIMSNFIIHVFSFNVKLIIISFCYLPYGTSTIRVSQSEVVTFRFTDLDEKKNKECSWEWLVRYGSRKGRLCVENYRPCIS